MLTCVQIQFKGPSRAIGKLSGNMITNVKLKLEISNAKAGQKNTLFFLSKGLCCFFPVNTEYMIKHQL